MNNQEVINEQNWQQVQIVPHLEFTQPKTVIQYNKKHQITVEKQPLLQRQQKQPRQPQQSPNPKQFIQPTVAIFYQSHLSSQTLLKPNLMQLSHPTSQLTMASATNPTQSQQQLTLKQLQTKYSQDRQPCCSNLQALKNLQRKINKNSHIKIQCKTEFPLVRAVAVGEFGWTLMSKQSHKQLVDIFWTDTYVTEQLVNRLRPYQKVNHFPYSTQMGRKDYLFANLNKMRTKYKDEYNFYAKTWIFPQEYQKFKQETESSQIPSQNQDDLFYIAKPVASCQGKGIFLAKRQDMLNHNTQNKLLVQEYMHNTLLIDGLKFDTRIYVLVKSLQPLSIYVYKEGLTRLATTQYEAPNQTNYRNGRMHLTNYAINKSNPNFVHNKNFKKDNIGHKRSLASLFQEIQKMGGNVQQVKEKINTIIVKTVLAVYEKMTYLQRIQHRIPAIRESIKNLLIVETNEDGLFSRDRKTSKPLQNPVIEYSFSKPQTSSKCFQLLGFDIMLTDKFEPKLIEINHQPSLTASSPLDYIIKKCLLLDVFSLLNIDSKDKEMHLNSQRETDPQNSLRGFELKGARKEINVTGWPTPVNDKEVQLGGFSCIYPVENQQLMSLYHKLMPMLILHESPPQTRAKKRQHSSFSFHKSQHNIIAPTFRQNKTSLSKKRQQYTCNYINMLGNEKLITKEKSEQNENTEGEKDYVILEESDRRENDWRENSKETRKKTTEGTRQSCMRSRVTPRIKMSKMAQYDLPKKNLNFTIKHMRANTKSVPRQTQSPQHSSVLPINQQMQSVSVSVSVSPQNINKPKTPYQVSKLTFTKTPRGFYNKIQLINDHSNNMMKEIINTEPRHSSHDTRIGIRLIKEKQDAIGKIEIVTRGISTPNDVTRKQTISLQKYSYPIYEKTSTSSTTTPNTPSVQAFQSVTSKPQSRSMRRNAEYFDRVYEKQLIHRINKMKTMKEKLQKLKKSSNKSEHEFIASREQFRINKINQSHKSITATVLTHQNNHIFNNNHSNDHHPKQKSHSITAIQPQAAIRQQLQRHLPFQTIKLMQFQQPHTKKANHNHTQKHKQSKDKFNTSMEMFKDQAFFNSHKKQPIHNLK